MRPLRLRDLLAEHGFDPGDEMKVFNLYDRSDELEPLSLFVDEAQAGNVPGLDFPRLLTSTWWQGGDQEWFDLMFVPGDDAAFLTYFSATANKFLIWIPRASRETLVEAMVLAYHAEDLNFIGISHGEHDFQPVPWFRKEDLFEVFHRIFLETGEGEDEGIGFSDEASFRSWFERRVEVWGEDPGLARAMTLVHDEIEAIEKGIRGRRKKPVEVLTADDLADLLGDLD